MQKTDDVGYICVHLYVIDFYNPFLTLSPSLSLSLFASFILYFALQN